MNKFEVVSRFEGQGIALPVRKTAKSAGYDLAVAEDIIVPCHRELISSLAPDFAKTYGPTDIGSIATMSKQAKCRPTLVSTGLKCQIKDGEYLELSVRSSTPLKYWLILANGVGIIDGDYYNNPDNEGEIFLQLINLSPFDIQLKKGDVIGQAIFKHYDVTEDDVASGERVGGLGSTSK